MAYPFPNLQTLFTSTQNYLSTAQLGKNGTVPAPNSALSVLGTCASELTYLLYLFLNNIELQANPYTATGDACDNWGKLKGIVRLLPQASSGSVIFTGTTGIVIPSNTVITTNDGTQFQTQAIFTIGTTTSVSILCSTVGSAGNYPALTNLSLSIPITGVTSVSLVSGTSITGGSDAETDSAYKTRYLTAYQSMPTGGSASDFVNWALASTPNCTRAWVAPNTSATSNIVVIYVMFDNNAYGGFPQGINGGATDDNRIPNATEDLLTVANYIYTRRPVTSIPYVCAPISYPISLTINPLITSTAAVEAAITTAIQNMLLVKQTPLGMTLYQSDITTAIASVADVSEFVLTGYTTINIPLGYIPTVATGSIVFD